MHITMPRNPRALTSAVFALLLLCFVAAASIAPGSADAEGTFPLTVTTSGDSYGSVTTLPAATSCDAVCVTNYPAGTELQVLANPSIHASFTDWNGDCSGLSFFCALTMDGPKTVDAGFGSILPPVVTPHIVAPHIVAPEVTPARKRVKRGKATVFKATVKNDSDGNLTELKLCVKVPKRLVRVRGPRCRGYFDLNMAAREKTFKFKVRVKPKAKSGRTARLRFTLSWLETGDHKATVVRVKVRK